jgi:hypothetical protein
LPSLRRGSCSSSPSRSDRRFHVQRV